MKSEFLTKFKEAIIAIVPIIVALVAVNYIVPGLSVESSSYPGSPYFGPAMTSLLVSTVPLIMGTTLFAMGAEKSIAKIGEIVGNKLTKRRSIILLLVIALLLGILATIAEPDLMVLSKRINGGKPDWTLIIIAAVGVGLFLVVGILRVVHNKKLKYWIAMGYGLVFTLGCLADQSFFSIVFDAGGVTTGVVTVPFILALGVSVASKLGGKDAEDASFGYSGLCSLGTVLAVMLFSIILRNTVGFEGTKASIEGVTFTQLDSYKALGHLYLDVGLESIKNVAISMGPIFVFFLIFNIFIKTKGRALGAIFIGFAYTFVGLVLFFMGAETGFIPVATAIGQFFGEKGPDMMWLLLIIGGVLGAIAMLAEPAVGVLAENVAEVSRGSVSKPMLVLSICAATAIAIILNVIRVVYEIDLIIFVAVLFIIAITLAFVTPEIYVGIAVDAAGVATGTMASCVFLPMFIGYTSVVYSSDLGPYTSKGEAIMTNGFGVVGLMSIMPIIAVELLGFIGALRTNLSYAKALKNVVEADDSQVIHLPSQISKEVN